MTAGEPPAGVAIETITDLYATRRYICGLVA